MWKGEEEVPWGLSMSECTGIYLGIHVCVSMNMYTCMGVSCVCGYMRYLSQNVYTAASTIVAGVERCARKTEDENQGGGDQ